MTMIAILAAIYRANPFRPHCGGGHHVRLCRLIVPHTPLMCEEYKGKLG